MKLNLLLLDFSLSICVCLTIAAICSVHFFTQCSSGNETEFLSIFWVHLCLSNTIDFFSLTFETNKKRIDESSNESRKRKTQKIHKQLIDLKFALKTKRKDQKQFDVFTLNFREKTLNKH